MGKRQQREKDVKARAGLTDGGRTWRAGTSEVSQGELTWVNKRKNGQLTRRSSSKVEGREVDIAHSTALIF